ncbi:GNAT family N-acetyltransferase [Streptomyces sp. PR69]|uniref:GNAT family N-acetyltransferase n=1 Tax=Streptomyces sp. PR69 TaxID=2984950 RepID=UPI002263D781|nr:GNAT family N-acetyltransferase [Streptomyces sp. PR69]
MSAELRQGLAVTLCRDAGDFARLRDEWNALHRSCAAATPFQNHAWLHSWWLSYGAEGRLRVVLARRAGRLIGAAPLMLVHRPMPLLTPMGGSISDFSDLVVDDAEEPAALTALEHGLLRAARHAVIDLREVRPGAVAERLYERWSGARARLSDSVTMELPALPIEEVIKTLPRTKAQRARAKLRKIDVQKIEGHSVSAAEAAAAVDHMLRLHELQWRGRGINVEHLQPRFASHLARAAERMIPEGEAAITEWRLDGEVVAAHMTLLSNGLTGSYLYGAHPDLRKKKVDVAAMLLRRDALHSAVTGRSVLSMLRGAESYKNAWGPRTVVNQRLLLARPSLEPLLRLRQSQARCRERAVEEVRSRFPEAREWRNRLNSWRADGVGR